MAEHSWTIDSSSTPTPRPMIPAGQAVLAAVRSMIHTDGPRDLLVFSDGSRVAVRRPEGDLLWLWVFQGVSAYADPESNRVRVFAHDESSVFPRDLWRGDEALAVLNLDEAALWANAQWASSTQSERVVLLSENWGELVAIVDHPQAYVVSLAPADAPDRPLVSADRIELVPSREHWFRPEHLRLGEWPFEIES